MVYAQRAIVVDALAVLRDCGLAEGTIGSPGSVEAKDEEAQVEAVGKAIAAIGPDKWEQLSHQQRQILLVAQATVKHYPGPGGFDVSWQGASRSSGFPGEARSQSPGNRRSH
jgi:hypothetical protein